MQVMRWQVYISNMQCDQEHMQCIRMYVHGNYIKVKIRSGWQADSSDTVKNVDYETCTVKLSIPQMFLQCLFVRINSALLDWPSIVNGCHDVTIHV